MRFDTSDVEIWHKYLQLDQNSKLPPPNSSRKKWVISHPHNQLMAIESSPTDDHQFLFWKLFFTFYPSLNYFTLKT